jgi:hypothetical protein
MAARSATGRGEVGMTKQDEPVAAEAGRQEYEPPDVRTEEVFETLALTCTKVDVQQCQVAGGATTLRS